jgi:hypothetical protein
MKNYSDYDIYTNIKRSYTNIEIYDEFMKILRYILNNSNLYFLELKIESKNGKKYKWFPNEIIKKNDFIKSLEDLNFIKIDFSSYSNYMFNEISINYDFYSEDTNNTKKTKNEIIKDFETDIKDLKKNKKYFKILKRIYSISKLNKDSYKMKKLQNIFNDTYGVMYKTISNLKLIEQIQKYYKDPQTKKKIEINLSTLNEPLQFKDNLEKKEKEINNYAKKIYDELK